MSGSQPERTGGASTHETILGEGRRAVADDAAVREPGTRVGRYIVLDRIGSGGMGVVYAAYDPQLDRKVALKLLRVEPNRDPERLLREAQALARLSHPNVVAIHDVGTHEGALFLAMEHVVGQTLRAWLDGAPRPWPEALAVLISAGRGIATAHAAELVHRDFKPENVMVGSDGRVRVMDFGLARVLDTVPGGEPTGGGSSGILPTVGTAGTPAYMSPEQHLERSTDAKTDQFSFSVVLYEALYGERPYAGTTHAEIAMHVLDGDVRPSPSGTRVPGWVRRVVARGLALEPEQRWPTMEAMLARLADDPARRHRRWLTVGIGTALIAALAWFVRDASSARAAECDAGSERLVGAWDESRRDTGQDAFVASGVSYASEAWDRTAAELDGYADEWVTEYRDACEATRDGRQSGELLDLRMACLEKRRIGLRALVDVLAAEPDAQLITRSIDAVAALPDLSACSDAQTLRSGIAPPTPEIAAGVDAIEERAARMSALASAGRYARAEPLATEVVEDARALGYEPFLARALFGLARTHVGRASNTAEPTLREAFLTAVRVGDDSLAADIATELTYVVGTQLARLDDALAWSELADAELHRAGIEGEPRALLLERRATIFRLQRRFGEARASYDAAATIMNGIESPRSTLSAIIETGIGSLLYEHGRFTEAGEHYASSASAFEAKLGPNHPVLADALHNWGIVLEQEGRYDEALALHERTVAIKLSALGPDSPDLAIALASLANSLGAVGRFDEAMTHHRRALAIREQALGPDHPDVAYSLSNMGSLFEHHGRDAEALQLHERSLVTAEKAFGSSHPNVAAILCAIGGTLGRMGQYDGSEQHFTRALAILAAEPEHPFVTLALAGLGQALLAQGRPDQAVAVLERALYLGDARGHHPNGGADVRFALAQALWDSRRDRKRAMALAEQARDLWSAAGPDAADPLTEVQKWIRDHP